MALTDNASDYVIRRFQRSNPGYARACYLARKISDSQKVVIVCASRTGQREWTVNFNPVGQLVLSELGRCRVPLVCCCLW